MAGHPHILNLWYISPYLEPRACVNKSSQGYFSSFLILHIYCRHRFGSTGFKPLDQLTRLVVYVAILGLAGAVCYSRLVFHFFRFLFLGWTFLTVKLSVGII